jgi:hypothetical protein
VGTVLLHETDRQTDRQRKQADMAKLTLIFYDCFAEVATRRKVFDLKENIRIMQRVLK